MNDDLMEECKHDLSIGDTSLPVDNSLQSCISLLEDLGEWLHSLRQRSQFDRPANFWKYSESILANEIQNYEKRKHNIFKSVLSTIQDRFQGFASSSELPDFPIASNQIPNTMDQRSNQLLRALVEFQREWDATVHQIAPIDPLTDQTRFMKDIELDLEKIDAWLEMLTSNLPNTSAWMTCLMSLSDVQKFSAAKYYQVCLKQIEQYSKTLSTIKELVDRVEVNTMTDLSFQNNLHILSRRVCESEAKCYTLWLRLLELSIYIDQNPKLNINKVMNTDISQCRPNSDIWNKSLLNFNSKETESQFTVNRNGHESGFESEQSPPLKSFLSYPCTDTATSCGLFITKGGEGKIKKENSYSLPNDFNLIGEQSIKSSLDHKMGKHSELDIKKSVQITSSQQNILTTYESGCTVNYQENDSVSLPDQQCIGHSLKQEMIAYETSQPSKKLLLSDNSNKSVNTTFQTDRSLFAYSNSSPDTILFNKHEWKQNLVTESHHPQKLKLQNHRTILKCFSSPILMSLSSSSGEHTARSCSLSTNTRLLHAQNTHSSLIFHRTRINSWNMLHCKNNYTDKSTKDVNKQTLLINKCKLHNLYYLKRIRNKRLKISSPNFSLKIKTKRKSKSAKFLKYKFIQNMKVGNNNTRNCISSTSLNLSKHIRNKILRQHCGTRQVSKLNQYKDPNSISEVTSNSSYCCESLPDDASELEQRRWRKQVRTYLNAAAEAEELVRNRYSPTRFTSWLAGLNTDNLKLGHHDNNTTKNHNHAACIDSISEVEVVNRRQNTQHRNGNKKSNNNSDSTSQLSGNLDTEIQEEEEMKASKDDDLHEPLLNFWDDYQASLYSNSSDVQVYEPPSTYAEEFPWDDVGSIFFIDDEPQLNSSLPSCSESLKLIKSISGDSITQDNDYSINYRQDIISTSTSAMFNQKSSMETSFEVCNNTSRNYSHRTESWSVEHTDNLLNPDVSVRGLRTCPDGGSQYLPSIETMDITSNCEAEELSNPPKSVSNLSQHLTPPHYTCYTKQSKSFNAYERKYQTVPRTTNRKRKAQINSHHSEKQPMKRDFLSLDASLNYLNDRYFNDIHKGILEHSGTRLLNAENYLQHLLTSIRRNKRPHRRNRVKRISSDNWHHRTAHLLQTAEAHVKLLSNLLSDLKADSSDISEQIEDDYPHSFIQDITLNKNENSNSNADNNNNDNNNNNQCNNANNYHHSPDHLVISNALKLKSQWTKFLSKLHQIHHQSNQYETWEKQLCMLQTRMHDLSRLTRQIGLSMYMNKEVNDEDNISSISNFDDYNPGLFDESQMDKISYGFRRCFSELDSLNYALDEIQNELNENGQTSMDNNNNDSNITISNPISLDNRLLQEIDRLSNQLAVNRSILQRLIRLFESHRSNQSTTPDDKENDSNDNNVNLEEMKTEDKINTTEESIDDVEMETSEIHGDEHLWNEEAEKEHLISPSNAMEKKQFSIYSFVSKLLHRIFPFNNHNLFIVLAGGFLFIAYISYYILNRLLICNNHSRRLSASSSSSSPSSSTSQGYFSAVQCLFGSTNGNDLIDPAGAPATAYHNCPLDRDKLSSIIDYTNGVQPY
ncbi:unnamed protein product [Heterobilharzia americana]|nr:unnamed protein product [Heterobilharzia americana]